MSGSRPSSVVVLWLSNVAELVVVCPGVSFGLAEPSRFENPHPSLVCRSCSSDISPAPIFRPMYIVYNISLIAIVSSAVSYRTTQPHTDTGSSRAYLEHRLYICGTSCPATHVVHLALDV